MKVLKFGGSSLASSEQFAKVKNIVNSDKEREVVIVSAPGKRSAEDNKITDLLYLLHAHIQYGVSHESVMGMIKDRYIEIKESLGLSTDIEKIINETFEKVNKKTSADFIASRGEYFYALLTAEYLGFEFADATEWVEFDYKGKVKAKMFME